MTISPLASEAADTLERTRLLAFVAQSLAVRTPRPGLFDDVEGTISSVREAIDEITELLPTPDQAANYDLRQGCELLADAIDLVEEADGARLSRPLRRRVTVLNAQAADHIASALDRLGTVTPLAART
jgi:hypothetical protein